MAKRISVGNLKNQAGISSEMRRIYRESRRGLIDPDTGKVLMNMLRIISETHLSVELEQALESIESETVIKTRSIPR